MGVCDGLLCSALFGAAEAGSGRMYAGFPVEESLSDVPIFYPGT